MKRSCSHSPDHLLRSATAGLHDNPGVTEYHHNLLQGLRGLVGCDGALFRPGATWQASQAYYLEADTRFTDDYVARADAYRPQLQTWCELTKGNRAVIDTEVYSTRERRRIALYCDVVSPARIKSILGCPLSVGGRLVGLIYLYRTGLGRPFSEDQARALDPILSGLAHAELRLAEPAGLRFAQEVKDSLLPSLRPVFVQLLTGKTEKEIAARLNLSARTVHKYTEQIYRHLAVNSRPEFMARFLRKA